MSKRGMIGWMHWAAAIVLGMSAILVVLSVGVDPLGQTGHDCSPSVMTSVAGIDGGDVDHEAHSHSKPGTCHAGGHCSPVALFVASTARQTLAARRSRRRPASRRAGSRLIGPDIRPPIA